MPFQPGNPGRPAVASWDRFWRFVEVEVDCWIWRGATSWDGYGRFRRGKDMQPGSERVHRIAWEFLVGAAPPGEPDHLCRRRNCVNPDHLSWGTRLQNHRRGYQYGRRRLHAWRRPQKNTGTPDERIVDLDPDALAALELDPARGLYPVMVEPAAVGSEPPLALPNTAMQ